MSRKLRICVLFDLDAAVPADHDYAETFAEGGCPTERDVVEALRELGHEVRPLSIFDSLSTVVATLERERPDLVFNLSEAFAHDRRHEPHLAAVLELLGIPYTGADPAALALCKDKALAKKILTYHRIRTPHFVQSPKARPLRRIRNVGFPAFVKPASTEASEGIAQAALAEDERSALERVAFIHERHGCDALVEEYVDGRELYAGVLGNDRLEALPLVELLVGDAPLGAEETPAGAPRFFTYKAKWDEGYRKRWSISSGAPRELPAELEKHLQDIARRACQVLRVRGYGRVDLRLTDSGEVFVIEVNPNPGLAKDEDFTQAAKRAGIDYPALLDRIVKLAERAHAK